MAGIRDEALLFLIAFDDRMNGNAGENQKQDKDQKQTGKADQQAGSQKVVKGLQVPLAVEKNVHTITIGASDLAVTVIAYISGDLSSGE